MAGTARPNLGLIAGYAAHESGWGISGFTPNFNLLDAVVFLAITNATTTGPPGSPSEGDRYIVATGGTGAWATHDDSVAIYRGAAWNFYVPKSGWRAFNNGTSSYVRFNGSAWVSDSGAGGGGLTLISTLTASASASLAWTGLATQTTWHLVGRLLVPATNNTTLQLNVGTGAGPTYITTGYDFARKVESSASSASNDGGTNLGYAPIDDGALTNATTPGVSFEADIITDNATFLHVIGKSMSRSTSPNDILTIFGAKLVISAPITAIKLSMGAGNITSGNASLYSLAA